MKCRYQVECVSQCPGYDTSIILDLSHRFVCIRIVVTRIILYAYFLFLY